MLGLYWGLGFRVMEKKMEATIMGLYAGIYIYGFVLGL